MNGPPAQSQTVGDGRFFQGANGIGSAPKIVGAIPTIRRLTDAAVFMPGRVDEDASAFSGDGPERRA